MRATVVCAYIGECCAWAHLTSATAEGVDVRTIAKDVVKRLRRRQGYAVGDVLVLPADGSETAYFTADEGAPPARQGRR